MRALCRHDARQLVDRHPSTAYYDAHRLASRARIAGDRNGSLHWASVAAEVARISDAPMELEVVKRILEEEQQRAGR
jgi:hypothetical protein